MRIDLLTLFPEACEPFFDSSIVGRARRSGRVSIACHNLRDYSTDPHRKVDDRPFGGGPGMVLMCQPVFDAVNAIEQIGNEPATRILLTPAGERMSQRLAEELATHPRLLLVAGHYEGFDERIRLGLAPREISIGDYVLSGGEAAAMVIVDAVVRLLPGVLGDDASAAEESFSNWRIDSAGSVAAGNATELTERAALLEYPQYTRPREFRGMSVPDILMSGDHGRIRTWRREQAVERTRVRRPDLLNLVPTLREEDDRPDGRLEK
ncbi:MAG: tRNA (guanosine(37)-N1)-methyltransferase TrmD [Phycisphaerae bacterium]|nr:tRNA (guanosine(37)-N1)-methyltransferase TrmD [Phycisphaerae bacterium]